LDLAGSFREPALFEVRQQVNGGGTSSQATTKIKKLQIKEFICSLDFLVLLYQDKRI
jgi:hypothetical protein